MSDATNPAFDKGGKYLYFLSSTNTGFTAYGLDMESDEHPTSSYVYAAVLHTGDASPISFQSDEEPVKETGTSRKPKPAASAAPKPAAAKPEAKTIDFDAIGQRIVALADPGRELRRAGSGVAGTIFCASAAHQRASAPAHVHGASLRQPSRKVMPYAEGVSGSMSRRRQEGAARARVRPRRGRSSPPRCPPHHRRALARFHEFARSLFRTAPRVGANVR